MKVHSKETLYFTLLLLIFNLAIIYMSFSYDGETRLMPLLVAIPTLGLVLFQVLVQFYPNLQSRFEIDLFSSASLSKPEVRDKQKKGSLLFHIFLTFSYFILILLLGFLIATPLYMLIFFKTHSKQSWFKSIAAAGIAWGLLYLIFSVLMKFILFEGILFGGRL